MSKQNNNKSPEMILLESYIKGHLEQATAPFERLMLEAEIIEDLQKALRELRSKCSILQTPHIHRKRSWE